MTAHNKIPTNKLIADLQQVNEKLGESPTRKQYKNHGEYGTATIERRFDGWTNALKQADLEPNYDPKQITVICDYCDTEKEVLESSIKNNKYVFCDNSCKFKYFQANDIVPDPPHPTGEQHPRSVNKQEVIQDYKRVAEKLGKTPAQYEYDKHGKYSHKVTKTVFNGMKDLQKQAGLEPLKNGMVTLTCEICGMDFPVKHSRKDNRRCCSPECSDKWRQKAYAGENNHNWKGGQFPYGKGWNYRKKEAVRQRDNRKCRECGRSEQQHIEKYGTKHHVHHIKKARKVDDPEIRNSMDNLITLCHGKCHKKWEAIPLKPQ